MTIGDAGQYNLVLLAVDIPFIILYILLREKSGVLVLPEPKVSVIMPVYNASAHLRECLDSVVAQTFEDIEIILVDDGSTDDSVSIIGEYSAKDPRVTLLQQPKSNAGAARNKGIDRACGSFLIFWDSDDIFNASAIELLLDRAEETGADIVVSGADQLDDETGKILPAPHYFVKGRTPKDTKTFNRTTNPDRILNFTTSVVWNKLFRRSFIMDNDIRFQEIRNGNDVFFTVTALCMADKISYVDKKLMTYRKCQKSSLVGTLTSAPLVPINAWRDTAESLQAKGIFPKVSFANKAIDSMVYLLRNLPSLNAFTEAVDYLKDGVLETLGLTDLDREDYIVKWHADFVEVLMTATPQTAFEWMYEFDYKHMASANSEILILKNDKKKLNKKIESSEQKIESLNDKVKQLEDDIADLNNDIDDLESDLEMSRKNESELKDLNSELKKEISDIRGSVSFKIGRFFTFIPRKLKKLFKK